MRILRGFIFLFFFVGDAFSMETDARVRENPYALLAVEDSDSGEDVAGDGVEENCVRESELSDISKQEVLFGRIRNRGFRALDSLSEAFAQGYDVNKQNSNGNTILHVALMQPCFDCAHFIVSQKCEEIDTSLTNRSGMTVLDIAYARLADLTVSIGIGHDEHGRFYYVARSLPGKPTGIETTKSYNIQRHVIPCGSAMKDMYTISYLGIIWCFDAVPLCSIVGMGRHNFRRSGLWQGWLDTVCRRTFRGRVRRLKEMIEMLGGNDIGFAHYLADHRYF